MLHIMDNIKIRETDNFKELTPTDGYVITNWDGKEIINFTYTTVIVAPKEYNLNGYYTIPVDKANELENELNNEIERITNQNN